MLAQQTNDVILDGPLLFGRVLDGSGGGAPISWEAARHWRPQFSEQVLWLHVDRTVAEVLPWLQELGIPEPTAEMLVSHETRPRAFAEGNALAATLRGVNYNPGEAPEDMIAFQIWSDNVRVITLRRRRLQSPRDVLAKIDAGDGARDAGQLITHLLETLIQRISITVVEMNELIDAMESQAGGTDTKDMLAKIAAIRRSGLALQRHMAPQHEALEAIAREAPPWFGDDDRREVHESIDRLRRYLEDINISKESALVLQDDIRARALARSERTSYLLTIVAAIFLPLGFLTGLLGINVGGMPGASNEHAFWVVVGLCLVVLALQLLLFRNWRWL